MLYLRLIDQVRSKTPYAPPVTCIQDDMDIHDVDKVMVNVSIGLFYDLTMDSLIGKIRVSRT